MWTLEYILSQAFVIVAMIFLASSYFVKSKKLILFVVCLSSVFSCSQYLLLHAYTGAILNVIAIFRGLWFYLEEKYKQKHSWLSLVVLILAYAVASALTFNWWIDIFAFVAITIFTIAIWQSNVFVYRWLSIFMSAFWIVYEVAYFSLFAVICESIILISEVIGVILYLKSQDKQLIMDENSFKTE
ncbi:MAG: YgjV family protein [Clostridia bacterium]|nr:YgjV family protein [Clostridia bacterium]